MAEEKKTTDHSEIKNFAEERNMKPAVVKPTDADGGQAIIRLMQPDRPQSENENLGETTWEKWFEDFDRNRLALVYDDESSFNKLVSR